MKLHIRTSSCSHRDHIKTAVKRLLRRRAKPPTPRRASTCSTDSSSSCEDYEVNHVSVDEPEKFVSTQDYKNRRHQEKSCRDENKSFQRQKRDQEKSFQRQKRDQDKKKSLQDYNNRKSLRKCLQEKCHSEKYLQYYSRKSLQEKSLQDKNLQENLQDKNLQENLQDKNLQEKRQDQHIEYSREHPPSYHESCIDHYYSAQPRGRSQGHRFKSQLLESRRRHLPSHSASRDPSSSDTVGTVSSKPRLRPLTLSVAGAPVVIANSLVVRRVVHGVDVSNRLCAHLQHAFALVGVLSVLILVLVVLSSLR